MFGEFVDQVLLIILGAVLPPIIIWTSGRIGALRLEPATWRILLLSTAISLFLSAFFIATYDRGWLPFAKIASLQHVKYEFGKPYQNSNRGTLIITVSAINTVAGGNTMCAAVVDNYQKLPQPKSSNCGDMSTVASASFSSKSSHSSMTFVVPRGYWYNVTIDGGSIEPIFWTEYLL